MRTLSKPKGTDKAKSPATFKSKQNPKQSKKVAKTVFVSPFRYHIRTLPTEEQATVGQLLLKSAIVLRKQSGLAKVKPLYKQKFIGFEVKAKLQKPTLITPKLVYGIKQCLSSVKKQQDLLIIIFYDEKRHETYEELMCALMYYKSPYIVMRESPALKEQLGLKNLQALGVKDEILVLKLEQYRTRCLIQIPWLVDASWQPLER